MLHLRLPRKKYLRCVDAYKHVGALQSRTGAMGPELAARKASTKVAQIALHRPILRNRSYTRGAKKSVIVACVDSRLFQQAGTWGGGPPPGVAGARDGAHAVLACRRQRAAGQGGWTALRRQGPCRYGGAERGP